MLILLEAGYYHAMKAGNGQRLDGRRLEHLHVAHDLATDHYDDHGAIFYANCLGFPRRTSSRQLARGAVGSRWLAQRTASDAKWAHGSVPPGYP